MGLFDKEETNLKILGITNSMMDKEGFLYITITENLDIGDKNIKKIYYHLKEMILENKEYYNNLSLEECKRELTNFIKEMVETEDIKSMLNECPLSFEAQKQLEEMGIDPLDIKYCVECGTQLEVNAKFCTNCGAETLFDDNPNRNNKLEKKFPQLKDKYYFKCVLYEPKWMHKGTDQYKRNTCYLALDDDNLIMVRQSSILKTNNRSRTLLFSTISHINLMFEKIVLRFYLHIYMNSGEHIIFIAKRSKEKDFERIVQAFNTYKNNNSSGNVNNSNEDIFRYAELYEKGLLTQEEFEAKKRELL